MKFWKNWPYWVKGGAVGFIVWFILVVYQTFTWKLGIGIPVEQNLLNLILQDYFGVARFGGGKLEIWTIVPAIFIFVGIVLNWLYGKISTRGGSAFGGKNRNKDNSSLTL